MNSRQSHRGKRISLKQEKKAAIELGGKTMAASGATRLGGGGDVRVMGKIRLECKFTENDSYRLRYEDLRKVRKQAFKVLEEPVLQFAFYCNGIKKRAYAVISWGSGDYLNYEDHFWRTSDNSITFTENQLNSALLTGRIQLAFTKAKDPPGLRMFEILHWEDYLEGYNARNQHDSGVHGTSDPTKG